MAKIIDDKDMTWPRSCDACKVQCGPFVVQVGAREYSDPEELGVGTADMCPKCLREAVALLDAYEKREPVGGTLLPIGMRLKFPNQWNDGFVWGTVAGARTRVVNENQIKYDAGHFGSWTEPRFVSAVEMRLPDDTRNGE